MPTYQEAGIKGLVLDQWLGVFVPAGTPPAIVARLNAEMNKALGDATIRDSFLQSAQEPVGGSADAVRPPRARGFRQVRPAGAAS